MFNYTKQSIIFDFMNQSKKDYLEYLNKINSFITDPQWKTMLSIDGLLNRNLNMYLTEIIDDLNSNNYSVEYLEGVMLSIRNKINDLIKTFEDKTDVVERYYLSREIYSLYGIIEVITEGCNITKDILEMFKAKYGDSYLTILKTIDNLNPSELTKFDYEEENEIDFDVNSLEIQLYLLMKKWQDDQHLYHENIIIDRHNKAKTEFEEYAKNKYPYIANSVGLPLYALYVVNEAPIVELEQIEKFMHTWFYKKMANVIGGKNLGLAILKDNEVRIPLTYVIPVGSSASKAYLNELDSIENITYALRSSATVEDNENQSFAGLFVSVLNINKEDIKEAGERVYNSCFSKRVNSYVEHFNTEKPYMSMVLQEFNEPTHSGVWLGDSFTSGHMEWTLGNGEKLVSGKVTPNHEYWDENTNNDSFFEVSGTYVGKECIRLQEKLNTISDFEFCVVNNVLYFVQFRPVTKKIEKMVSTESKKESDVSGVPASSGYVVGHPVYLEEVEEGENFVKGDILLTDFTDPKWVPIMMKASAIVTAEGGFLSHSAIISRELGIPCVTGVGYSNIEKISEYNKISVDGTRGLISLEEN